MASTLGIITSSSGLCERDKRNESVWVAWGMLFSIAYLAADFLVEPSLFLKKFSMLDIGIALLPLITGFFMMKAFLHFARNADEFVKLMMMRAAAKGFFVVVCLGFTYSIVTRVTGVWEWVVGVIWIVGLLVYVQSFYHQLKEYDA